MYYVGNEKLRLRTGEDSAIEMVKSRLKNQCDV